AEGGQLGDGVAERGLRRGRRGGLLAHWAPPAAACSIWRRNASRVTGSACSIVFPNARWNASSRSGRFAREAATLGALSARACARSSTVGAVRAPSSAALGGVAAG